MKKSLKGGVRFRKQKSSNLYASFGALHLETIVRVQDSDGGEIVSQREKRSIFDFTDNRDQEPGFESGSGWLIDEFNDCMAYEESPSLSVEIAAVVEDFAGRRVGRQVLYEATIPVMKTPTASKPKGS